MRHGYSDEDAGWLLVGFDDPVKAAEQAAKDAAEKAAKEAYEASDEARVLRVVSAICALRVDGKVSFCNEYDTLQQVGIFNDGEWEFASVEELLIFKERILNAPTLKAKNWAEKFLVEKAAVAVVFAEDVTPIVTGVEVIAVDAEVLKATRKAAKAAEKAAKIAAKKGKQ